MEEFTVEQLYGFITQNMTPEQALIKLLEGQIKNYEVLKFNEGEEIHPLILISSAALEMGWSLAIPDGNDDDDVIGMSVGTENYLENLLTDPDEEALELLQYFVDRVEAGTIRSQTTYNKYKNYLNKQNKK